MLGNAFLAFMLAWSVYQMYKCDNIKIVRYGGVFLMVGTYIMVLLWALLLFSSRRPRNALFFLIFGLLMVGGILILSFWSQRQNYEIVLPAALAFIWILYLVYYTFGIINSNSDSLFGDFSDIEKENNRKLNNKKINNKNRTRKYRKKRF